VIEHDLNRCKHIAEALERTIVLHGDAADEELLLEENIEDTDVFCAVTNDDEANILSAMLAKRLGARKVMALINRTAYVDLVQSGPIDIAISPQQATIGSLLKHVRRGDVVVVHSLRRGAAEAIEAIAHGDEGSARSSAAHRGHQSAQGHQHRRHRARRRGHHRPPRHGHRVRGPRHPVPAGQIRVPEVEKLFQVGVTFF
jgi:trk system potassium uptake protein TrkA